LVNRKDDFSSFLLGNLVEKEAADETKQLPVVSCNKVLEICQRYLEAVSVFDSLVSSDHDKGEEKASCLPAEGVVDLTESGDESSSGNDFTLSSDESKVEPSQVSSLLLRPYSAQCSAQLNAGQRTKIKSETTNNEPRPVLSLLSVITLGASVCFRAYLKECSVAPAASTKPRPPFMSELNAGWCGLVC
jgi:hypothetical protein